MEDLSLQQLEQMLLCNIIKLSEIPFDIRINNRELYILAFRSAILSKQYEDDLLLMKHDLNCLKNDYKHLLHLYNDMCNSPRRSQKDNENVNIR